MSRVRYPEQFIEEVVDKPKIKTGGESINYDPNDIDQAIALFVKKHPELGAVFANWEIIYFEPAQSTGGFTDFILLVRINGQEKLMRGHSRLKSGVIPCAIVFYPTHLWDVLYTCRGPMIRKQPEKYSGFVGLFQNHREKTKEDINEIAMYLRESFPDSWGKIDLNKLKTLLDALPSKNVGKTFSVGEN